MSEIIINWLKKNFQILELLLLALAIILMICIVVKVPLECHSCLNNPIDYYQLAKNTTCWCSNVQYGW